MELGQLRYFVAVARAGTFTRAAEQEGVTQPALSQQVQKLEASLGVPLFERRGRSVRLTRAGERLLPRDAVLACSPRCELSVQLSRRRPKDR